MCVRVIARIGKLFLNEHDLFFRLFLVYWVSPKNDLGFPVPENRHNTVNLVYSLKQELSILWDDQFHCPIYKCACCGNTCLWLRKKCTLLRIKVNCLWIYHYHYHHADLQLIYNKLNLVHWKSNDKRLPWGTSSMVPWLESACQCSGRGFHPWSGRIPHAAGQLGQCTMTTEVFGPWSLCSTAREASAGSSPHTALESSSCLPQLEKACLQQRRPSTAKN